jgi:hypothetical protein
MGMAKYPDHRPVVYFLVSPGQRRVKIGTTNNLARRISKLQEGNPERLELRATVPGGEAEERRQFDRFRHLYALQGEWFWLRGQLATFLAGQPLPSVKLPPRRTPRPGRGTPENLNNGGRRLGNRKSAIIRAKQARHFARKVMAVVSGFDPRDRWSLRQVAARLNRRGIAAPRGGKWSASQVARCRRHAA